MRTYFNPNYKHLKITSMESLRLQQSESEDMISALPDHVLLSILDRVDIRTAARAGILSRRWRHLPRLLSHLDIKVGAFFPAPHTINMRKDMHQAMAAFTKATESLLANPASDLTIKDLRLEFYLMKKYIGHIRKLLYKAINGGKVSGRVEMVIVADVTEQGSSRPHAFLLRQFVCTSPNVFGRLSKLSLYYLRFGGSDGIARLLNICKHLEALSLYGCNCEEREVLQIDAPDSRLKELFLSECDFKRIKLLRVPKLARLTCDSWMSPAAPLSFGSVPCLQQLNISNETSRSRVRFKLSELLANATHIEHLSLGFYGKKIWIQPEDPKQLGAAFSKLKILVLEDIFYECDLLWTLLLLNAAPVLETFQIQVFKHLCMPEWDDEAKREMLFRLPLDLLQKASDFKHHSLKELRIAGFMVEHKQTQFIRLVLERAVSLKNINLTDKDPCGCSNACKLRTSWNEGEKDLIVKQLKEGISSPVQIVIR